MYLESLSGSRSSDSHRSITQKQIQVINQNRHIFVQNLVQKSRWTDPPAFFKVFKMELM